MEVTRERTELALKALTTHCAIAAASANRNANRLARTTQRSVSSAPPAFLPRSSKRAA